MRAEVLQAPVPQAETARAFEPRVDAASVKIGSHHRERLAVVYVRQSSPTQVLENRESTARQYAFAERAVALGWPRERVLTIDEDLGKSGRTTEGRFGFQRLVAEVTLNHVGLVLGLEMSRLARSSKDWHAFFEMCALFGTLIADEDGVYDGHDPNDRMLLGLKGIISEMELHTMRSRLNQGLLSKARRGELFLRAPIGYVRSSDGRMELDPDEQVQSVVRLIFAKFAEVQTASGVLKHLVTHGVQVGVRSRNGRTPDPVTWRRPVHGTLLQMLHNPTYAGAYCLGRRTSDPRRRGPHRRRVELPMAEWKVLLQGKLPAYITWEQFQANQLQLKANQPSMASPGPPRNGHALLAGLLTCGRCGARMSVHYKQNGQFRYCCLRKAVAYGEPLCQDVKGNPLDALVADKVLRALEPAGLELSLRAADDIEKEREVVHCQWRQRLERGRYEADRAARQYGATEPENRLVARELEKRWEAALQVRKQLEEDYDRFRAGQPPTLTAEQRELVHGLATAIPALWAAASTTPQDRKAVVRHLVDQVAVAEQGSSEYVDVTIHWAGGYVSEHEVVQPISAFNRLRDADHLKQRVIELHREGWTHQQIADRLNRERFHSALGRKFTGNGLHMFLRTHCREELALDRGPFRGHLAEDEWLVGDLSDALTMPQATLQFWRRRGWLHARQLKGSGRWIFWADADELCRLAELRVCPINYHPRTESFPLRLITPKARPAGPA